MSDCAQLGYRLNSIRGVLWEADSSYNLLTLPVIGVGFTPYLTLGAGALTTFVNGASSMLLVGGLQVASDGSSNFAPRNIDVEDGDPSLRSATEAALKRSNCGGQWA